VADSEKQPAQPVAAWLAWWAFRPFLWAWGLPLDVTYDIYVGLVWLVGDSELADVVELLFSTIFAVIGGGLAVGCDMRDGTYVLLGGELPEHQK
jgi:hypothetical protein